MAHQRIWKAATLLAALALFVGGISQLAHAGPPSPERDRTRGVIVLPGAQTAALGPVKRGDRPALAGQRVSVEQADPALGLLVSSQALGDAELASTLASAGLAAEVNQIRAILPVTPTAELFNRPQDMAPADRGDTPDFWHVQRIGADIVHAAGQKGDPASIVGVVDTGVYTAHPRLDGVVLPGMNFLDGTGDVTDDVGHGTHVSGIVHSICPKCGILPVKVLTYNGGDDYTIARGILYAQQAGARVVQISLGGAAPSATMCRAITTVEQRGALVVIAAGNNAGSDIVSIGYPAACSPDSLVVSATDKYDTSSWFSNYGPIVDLAAPGEAIWSTVPLSYYPDDVLPASGTSMAAPMVSGAAALLWVANPGWTAQQIRDRLMSTARDISTLPGVDDAYGPRVDVAQAFGLRSRPIVAGMFAGQSWVPKGGTDQSRTIHVQAHVRGEALSSVSLVALIGDQTNQAAMAPAGGDLYEGDYLVPANAGPLRDIWLRVVAKNSAGETSGRAEVIVQDGGPIAPPRIEVLSRYLYVGQPIKYRVQWDGTWDNFDFYCNSYEKPRYAVARGQDITCSYGAPGTYGVGALIFAGDYMKTSAIEYVQITYPRPLLVPLIRRSETSKRK